MKRQLLFRFDALRDKRIDALSQKGKEAITLALKEIMIAYFKMKKRKETPRGKSKD